MSDETETTDWSSLVARVLAGDKAAVTTLIEQAQNPVFVFCFHLAKNRQLAEDLTHDALLKSLASLAQLQKHGSYLAWTKTIARSLFLDYLKSAENAKAHLQFEDMGDDESMAEDPSVSVEQIHAQRTLQQLEENDRAILILIDIQEASYEEAAEIMGLPIGTVKSKLSRARDKFSALYDGTKATPRSSSSQDGGQRPAKKGATNG